MATLLGNSPAWVVADLAAAQSGVVHVPLPAFFTPAQVAHALRSAGVDTVLARPDASALFAPSRLQRVLVGGLRLNLLEVPAAAVALRPGTAKITFTSGTTGSPKGVCLDGASMRRVAEGIASATASLDIRRHLCALPLSVLLENIAGLMAPMARGATCITVPLSRLGFNGSSQFDAACFHEAVLRHRPHSVIVLPQMLRAWVAHLNASGLRAPDSLALVAVGGAAAGAQLIDAARAAGVPAYEGYGLSECASVQTLNLPGADRAGSAGRPLPHARVRVAPDGEVEVAGSIFAGYVGSPSSPAEWWPTGDLGDLDRDGYLHIHGRKKNVLITGYGRNVCPEWVETAMCAQPAIAHAVVLGDGQPALSAVLWPARPPATDAVLNQAVQAANSTLPDYARVQHWVRAHADFTPHSGLSTPNGRPRRDAVLRLHADALGLSAAAPGRSTDFR